jgi:hypothetical protein
LKGKTNNGLSLGENALFFKMTGIGNIAIGGMVLWLNDVGNLNTAIGNYAMVSNT